MDQNENKNLESVAEEATEVKDEVVEAAKETAEEVKEVAETVVEEAKEAKAPEADGDFKEVVEDVKEKAEQAKEKLGEAASKVFSEENKAKLDDAVQKVAGYNKNSLFEKIFFGISILIALFTALVTFNGLSFLFGKSNITLADLVGYMNATVNKIKNLNLYFGLTFFFTIVATVFVVYFFYAAKKEGKNLWTNVNVASLGMVVSVFCAHIFGSGFINGLGLLTDAFNGKANSTIAQIVNEALSNSTGISRSAQNLADGLQTGSKIAILFYLVALACSAATVYFYYQKLFQKKAQ
ncbi:hypothetical protein [Granulicatella sp. 20925_1_45]|jgi:uncharacterized protein PF11_0207|uniref:hypothetical protein n=1 Tax=Granulicatella sp. 20925_1_45 TaxID=3003685 RepID=UPI00352D19C8